MGLGDLGDKAKDLISDNADKVKEQGGKLADKTLGDNADKAKDALNKGVDSLGSNENNEGDK